MNMLVQILFKRFKRFIQSLVTDANIGGNGVIIRYLPKFAQEFTSVFVLPHHHSNRMIDRAKRRERHLQFMSRGPLELHDVRKQNLFFFEHMWFQIVAESPE